MLSELTCACFGQVGGLIPLALPPAGIVAESADATAISPPAVPALTVTQLCRQPWADTLVLTCRSGSVASSFRREDSAA
jgi:hypothetical protein